MKLVVETINGRLELVPEKQDSPQYEKMSKSKGNSVSVDEVMNAVRELDKWFEFVTLPPMYYLVDYKKVPIYKAKDGFYYTQKSYGHIPVLLADNRKEYIPRFVGGVVQHESKIPKEYLEC